jgi:hypothetical protein
MKFCVGFIIHFQNNIQRQEHAKSISLTVNEKFTFNAIHGHDKY